MNNQSSSLRKPRPHSTFQESSAKASAASALSPLKIAMVGNVDDGKSTLIGRLLYETNSLPEGKLEEIKNVSETRGMPFEWSFALDSLQAERDQAITIDVTKVHLKTQSRNIVIIDTPGHVEFIKNMVSGAADADAAILIIDAKEGVREQTRRLGYLLYFLGVRQVIVIVNKMDLIDFSEKVFLEIKNDITKYFSEINIIPNFIIPISARQGDFVVSRSSCMTWYTGPTVLESLERIHQLSNSIVNPLRFPIQDVYKFDNKRVFVGKIESGRLNVGSKLIFSPSNKSAVIKSIESWNNDTQFNAEAGQSIGITLDPQLFIERGEIASEEGSAPHISNIFKITIFWLGEGALKKGKNYKLRIATQEANVIVQEIKNKIDITTLKKSPVESLEKNSCGEIIIRSSKLLAVDKYHDLPRTGRCVLIDEYAIVAAGMLDIEKTLDKIEAINKNDTYLTKVPHSITRESREEKNGHLGGVLWLTGLSASGKSTLAMALEKHLFNKGYLTYALDGDNTRFGVNSDLKFSVKDRSENIRRISEVAKLFSEAGFICVSAFISPYISNRELAREIIRNNFHEIYIKSDLATCETRDPRGLYKKARLGEIKNFTGVSAPYQEPISPQLVIDTSEFDIEQCIEMLASYVEKNFDLK